MSTDRRFEAKRMNAMNLGLEVQRDPYTNLLSESEKQSGKNLIPRAIYNAAAVGATAVYYLSRQNQIGRVRAMSITFDMIFSVGGRCLLAGVVADQAGRRLFVNYQTVKRHQMAEYEVKKIMRTWPDPKPMA